MSVAAGTRSVLLPGGEFAMGEADFYADEAPVHRVRVDAFKIDRYAVTNAEFGQFVAATGYLTVAERPLNPADYPGVPQADLAPGALVFTPTPGPEVVAGSTRLPFRKSDGLNYTLALSGTNSIRYRIRGNMAAGSPRLLPWTMLTLSPNVASPM